MPISDSDNVTSWAPTILLIWVILDGSLLLIFYTLNEKAFIGKNNF